jgi:hypothetical protein
MDSPYKCSLNKFLSIKDTTFDLKKHKKKDIIVTKDFLSSPLSVDIKGCVYFDDYKILCDVINDKFHDYWDAFRYVMDCNNVFYPCNMFITRWKIFNDYCEWLFAVLNEVEQRIIIKTKKDYRVFGIMGEYLLYVYIVKHNLKAKPYPIVKISEDEKERSLWGRLTYKITANLSFLISRPLRYSFMKKRVKIIKIR